MLKRRGFYIALRGNSVRERLIGSLNIHYNELVSPNNECAPRGFRP